MRFYCIMICFSLFLTASLAGAVPNFYPLNPKPFGDNSELIGVVAEKGWLEERTAQKSLKSIEIFESKQIIRLVKEWYGDVLLSTASILPRLDFLPLQSFLMEYKQKPIFIFKNSRNNKVFTLSRAENQDLANNFSFDIHSESEARQVINVHTVEIKRKAKQKREEAKEQGFPIVPGEYKSLEGAEENGYLTTYQVSVKLDQESKNYLVKISSKSDVLHQLICKGFYCKAASGAEIILTNNTPMTNFTFLRKRKTHPTVLYHKGLHFDSVPSTKLSEGYFAVDNKCPNVFLAYYFVKNVVRVNGDLKSFEMTRPSVTDKPYRFKCFGKRCVSEGNQEMYQEIYIESENVLSFTVFGSDRTYRTKIYFHEGKPKNFDMRIKSEWFIEKGYKEVDS